MTSTATHATIVTNNSIEWTPGFFTTTFRVNVDGDVLPFDAVAGHFTTCHDLTGEQVETVLAAARRQRPWLFVASL
jgi:hypothetical protein